MWLIISIHFVLWSIKCLYTNSPTWLPDAVYYTSLHVAPVLKLNCSFNFWGIIMLICQFSDPYIELPYSIIPHAWIASNWCLSSQLMPTMMPIWAFRNTWSYSALTSKVCHTVKVQIYRISLLIHILNMQSVVKER